MQAMQASQSPGTISASDLLPPPLKSVLVVEPDSTALAQVKMDLMDSGNPWTIYALGDPDRALEVLETVPVDALVTAPRQTQSQTVEFLNRIQTLQPRTLR